MDVRDVGLEDDTRVADCCVPAGHAVYCVRDNVVMERGLGGKIEWDARVGESERDDRVACLALAESRGFRLWCGTQCGRVKVFDVAQRQILADVAGHTGSVTAVLVHGKRVYTGGTDRAIIEWHSDTLEILRMLPQQQGAVRCILALGLVLLTTDACDPVIRCWNLSTCKAAGKLAAHKACVKSVMYHTATATLWSGADDGVVNLWDLTHLKRTASVHHHTQPVASMAQTSSGYAVTGQVDMLVVWSCAAAEPVALHQKFDVPLLSSLVTVADTGCRAVVWVVQNRLGVKAFEVAGKPVVKDPAHAASPSTSPGAQARGRLASLKDAMRARSAQRPAAARKRSASKNSKSSAASSRAENGGGKSHTPRAGLPQGAAVPAGRNRSTSRSRTPVGRGGRQKAATPDREAAAAAAARIPPKPASRSHSDTSRRVRSGGRPPVPSPAGPSRSKDPPLEHQAQAQAQQQQRLLDRRKRVGTLEDENARLRAALWGAQDECAELKKRHAHAAHQAAQREQALTATLHQTSASVASVASLCSEIVAEHPSLRPYFRPVAGLLAQASRCAIKTMSSSQLSPPKKERRSNGDGGAAGVQKVVRSEEEKHVKKIYAQLLRCAEESANPLEDEQLAPRDSEERELLVAVQDDREVYEALIYGMTGTGHDDGEDHTLGAALAEAGGGVREVAAGRVDAFAAEKALLEKRFLDSFETEESSDDGIPLPPQRTSPQKNLERELRRHGDRVRAREKHDARTTRQQPPTAFEAPARPATRQPVEQPREHTSQHVHAPAPVPRGDRPVPESPPFREKPVVVASSSRVVEGTLPCEPAPSFPANAFAPGDPEPAAAEGSGSERSAAQESGNMQPFVPSSAQSRTLEPHARSEEEHMRRNTPFVPSSAQSRTIEPHARSEEEHMRRNTPFVPSSAQSRTLEPHALSEEMRRNTPFVPSSAQSRTIEPHARSEEEHIRRNTPFVPSSAQSRTLDARSEEERVSLGGGETAAEPTEPMGLAGYLLATDEARGLVREDTASSASKLRRTPDELSPIGSRKGYRASYGSRERPASHGDRDQNAETGHGLRSASTSNGHAGQQPRDAEHSAQPDAGRPSRRRQTQSNEAPSTGLGPAGNGVGEAGGPSRAQDPGGHRRSGGKPGQSAADPPAGGPLGEGQNGRPDPGRGSQAPRLNQQPSEQATGRGAVGPNARGADAQRVNQLPGPFEPEHASRANQPPGEPQTSGDTRTGAESAPRGEKQQGAFEPNRDTPRGNQPPGEQQARRDTRIGAESAPRVNRHHPGEKQKGAFEPNRDTPRGNQPPGEQQARRDTRIGAESAPRVNRHHPGEKREGAPEPNRDTPRANQPPPGEKQTSGDTRIGAESAARVNRLERQEGAAPEPNRDTPRANQPPPGEKQTSGDTRIGAESAARVNRLERQEGAAPEPNRDTPRANQPPPGEKQASRDPRAETAARVSSPGRQWIRVASKRANPPPEAEAAPAGPSPPLGRPTAFHEKSPSREDARIPAPEALRGAAEGPGRPKARPAVASLVTTEPVSRRRQQHLSPTVRGTYRNRSRAAELDFGVELREHALEKPMSSMDLPEAEQATDVTGLRDMGCSAESAALPGGGSADEAMFNWEATEQFSPVRRPRRTPDDLDEQSPTAEGRSQGSPNLFDYFSDSERLQLFAVEPMVYAPTGESIAPTSQRNINDVASCDAGFEKETTLTASDRSRNEREPTPANDSHDWPDAMSPYSRQAASPIPAGSHSPMCDRELTANLAAMLDRCEQSP
ncbi:F-box/WD repeat-containing protein 7 [Diplonema papillatum]|nr:F-box/WD repeat-containing protein 7 [Diplonema papillatum]KAJ9472388.1 F-box/WD repeat-containing protein 7 [Diplonema papillatum]